MPIDKRLHRKTEAPNLNFHFRCKNRNATRSRQGIPAGCMAKLSLISPFKQWMMARCIPQPGQSQPVSTFIGHGSRWLY